jgi:hypothetical protein
MYMVWWGLKIGNGRSEAVVGIECVEDNGVCVGSLRGCG